MVWYSLVWYSSRFYQYTGFIELPGPFFWGCLPGLFQVSLQRGSPDTCPQQQGGPPNGPPPVPRIQKDHVNTRILQTIFLVSSVYCAFEPECEILMFIYHVLYDIYHVLHTKYYIHIYNVLYDTYHLFYTKYYIYFYVYI